jgi:hypothetical protein
MARTVNPDPTSTAAFSLTVSLVQWIEEQAAKRGISKAAFVREILDAARSEQRETVAA